jgi:putative ABC transport system permease protein
VKLSAAIYRALLRAYPRWFRERYENDLVRVFEAEQAHARYAGLLGGLAFWMHIAMDFCVSVIRVRHRSRAHITDNPPRRNAMDNVVQDLRYAFRSLAARPGFAAVAVLSLALGIGGNTMIFAFIDGIVFHPFPYPDADRIVTVGVTFPRMSSEERFIEVLSAAEVFDIKESRAIESLLVFDLGNRNISGGDRPERAFTGLAHSDPFGPFGLRPSVGRGFNSAELTPGGPAAAILSYRLWQSRFGGDPALVGRDVRVNGTPRTVVGIMPPELLILGVDLWLPSPVDPLALPRNARQFTMIGRLAPGATLQSANVDLDRIARRIAVDHGARFKEYDGWRLEATPWADALMRDVRPWGTRLLVAVALVLLIACVNLSNLLLARSSMRQREIAVRIALGAGRSRIMSQLLAEVAVLAVLGAAAGLLIAYAGLAALVQVTPRQLENLGLTPSVNSRVLLWTALFTIGATIVVALLPILQSTRTDPHDAMKADSRGATGGPAPRRLRHSLIVAEVALSILLLCGAGLFIRSFVRLQQVEPGFDATNVLTMRVTVAPEKFPGVSTAVLFARVNEFFQQVVDRVGEMPGVRAASVASQFPPTSPASMPFRIEGRDPGGATLPTALVTAASDEHFGLLGMRVVSGRAFDDRDRADTPRIVVINQAFASRFLPGVNPIGQRLNPPVDGPPIRMEIVGVVANTRNRGLRVPPAPEVFVPLSQQMVNNQLFLLVRTTGDATAMLPAVRQQIAAIDPEQPIYAIQTIEDAFSEAAFGQRMSMILFTLFATVALALAAVGIYGVMSYAVAARTQEIGIRMAIGAARRDVVWLVLGQVLRLTLVGLAIGVSVLMLAGGLLQRVLFEIQPFDPVAMGAAIAILASVALLAGWLPAWRASRVDPVVALRYE